MISREFSLKNLQMGIAINSNNNNILIWSCTQSVLANAKQVHLLEHSIAQVVSQVSIDGFL